MDKYFVVYHNTNRDGKSDEFIYEGYDKSIAETMFNCAKIYNYKEKFKLYLWHDDHLIDEYPVTQFSQKVSTKTPQTLPEQNQIKYFEEVITEG